VPSSNAIDVMVRCRGARLRACTQRECDPPSIGSLNIDQPAFIRPQFPLIRAGSGPSLASYSRSPPPSPRVA